MRRLKKYPLSILVILILCYLSFFRPPSSVSKIDIPHLDKLVHFCMYFGFSSILWFEFFKSKDSKTPKSKCLIHASLFPILMSGIIELLQEYCTSYRGGDWLDFLANSLGVVVATVLFYFYLSKKMN